MDPYNDSFGGQLIQRSVVVQKDERGYGLTVSGDNPVFVQNVKDYGAAYKAGVRQGDRIIKVNGTLVTQSNHMEVVNMIKAGSYVALTLLGRPPGSTQPLPPPHQPNQNASNRATVSGPRPAAPEIDAEMRSERVSTMRRMLDQEKELYEKTRAEYIRNPTEKLQKDLSGATTRVKVLEHQLAKLTGISSVQALGSKSTSSFSNPDSPASDVDAQRSPEDVIRERRERNRLTWLSQGGSHARQRSSPDTFFHQESNTTKKTSLKRNNSDAYRNDGRRRINQYESMSQKSRLDTQIDFLPPGISPDSDSAAESSPNTTPPIRRRGFMDYGEDGDTCKLGTSPLSHSTSAMEPLYATIPNDDNKNQIMCMEDDDFQSDGENLEDHGPFNDLESLVKRPAHMAVFLHYLISNSDPSSLFFYLVTDSYGTGSLKDMKKWCYEIFSTFLAPSGPLRIQVEENVVQKIESILSSSMDNEQAMKKVFVVARDVAVSEIRDLLGDFRNKRALGLGSIFGDQMLSNGEMDKNTELKVVEQTLMPHLERLSKNQAEKEDKNVAMAAAITTFMKQVGVKENSMLDRVQSFAAKDRSKLKIGKKAKTKISIKGHNFIDLHCTGPVFCHHCKGLLWGIGYQGLQCQNCDMTLHKTSPCVDELDKVCNKKEKRQSIMNIFIKGGGNSMSNNPQGSVFYPGDRSLLSPDDVESKPSVISPTGPSKILPMVARHEDAEVMDEMQSKNIVGSRISQFESGHEGSLMHDSCNVMESLDECPEEEDEQPVHRANLSRSESLQLKGEEKIKAGHGRRSKSDVDLDTEKANSMLSQCSSSSSMSTRSHDSLFSSCDSTFRHDIHDYDDSDLDVESVIPNWQDNVSKDLLKKMKSKEIRRQEIINELFHTERTHVRGLKVLDRVFYRPMQQERILDQEIKYIFPNLIDLLEVHTSLNNKMKKRKEASSNNVIEEVADILLERFEGEEGEKMRKVCATFCENQAAALENLKAKQAKDPKVAHFMTEAESNHLCRRLPFPGIISIVYQRLTKYPMLIENLLKYTQPPNPDLEKLPKALECSKQILSYVNQAVKECENQQKLLEISRRMDTSPLDRSSNPIVTEYKNIDLTNRKLLHYGDLTWKIGKTKKLDLHVLLLDDILVLLQKQDERYVLKCHSMTVQRGDDVRTTHSPIVKLATLLCRNVATNKKAFFLVSTQVTGPQIYELVASTAIKRQAWMDVILAAQEAAKKRPSRRRDARTATVPIPIIQRRDDEDDREPEVIVTPAAGPNKAIVVEGPEIIDASVATVVRVNKEEAVRHKTRPSDTGSHVFDGANSQQLDPSQDITTPLTDILKKELNEGASSKDIVQYLLRLTRKCKQTIDRISDEKYTKVHIDHISMASDMYTQRLKELLKSLVSDDKHQTELQTLLDSERKEKEILKQRISELENQRTNMPSADVESFGSTPPVVAQRSSVSDDETQFKVLNSLNKDSSETSSNKSDKDSREKVNEHIKGNDETKERNLSREEVTEKLSENHIHVFPNTDRTNLDFENVEHNYQEQVTNLDDSDRSSMKSDGSHSDDAGVNRLRGSESGSGSDRDTSPRNTIHFAVPTDSHFLPTIENANINKKNQLEIEPIVIELNQNNQVDDDDDDDDDITIPAFPDDIEPLPTGQLHHVKMAKEEVVMHEAPEFLHDNDGVTLDLLSNSRPQSLISVGSSSTTEGLEYIRDPFESETHMHAMLSKENLLEHEHENIV